MILQVKGNAIFEYKKIVFSFIDKKKRLGYTKAK